MQFHLAHIVPNKTLHGLNGYKEVIDTVQWGLRQLGHSAEYGLNTLSSTATNIIFGLQCLELSVLNSLPQKTIFYQLEQKRDVASEQIKPQVKVAAERFEIWDYSAANNWVDLGAKRVRVVPIGYAPILQRVPQPAEQDIDVLIYGSPGQSRLGAFYHIAQSGLTTVFLCGLYGKARDELIGRSKIVLNINLYEYGKIFEIVRVSYLLANRKAVVADIDVETAIDQDMREAVRIVTPSELVNECRRLCQDDHARKRVEEVGFALIENRDIRSILQRALSEG
jgi:hypothetical protein